MRERYDPAPARALRQVVAPAREPLRVGMAAAVWCVVDTLTGDVLAQCQTRAAARLEARYASHLGARARVRLGAA